MSCTSTQIVGSGLGGGGGGGYCELLTEISNAAIMASLKIFLDKNLARWSDSMISISPFVLCLAFLTEDFQRRKFNVMVINPYITMFFY
jgi:hypothetical protein